MFRLIFVFFAIVSMIALTVRYSQVERLDLHMATSISQEELETAFFLCLGHQGLSSMKVTKKHNIVDLGREFYEISSECKDGSLNSMRLK